MIYVLFLLAIAALITGVVLVMRGRWKGHTFPSCGKCGYDVSGSVGSVSRCPECGVEFTKGGILPPRRRGPRTQLITGCLLIAVSTGIVIPAIFVQRTLAVRQQLMQAARAQAIQAQMAMQRAQKLAEASASLAEETSELEDETASPPDVETQGDAETSDER